ncbi:MAG: hypothetical protein ABW022_14880 [Actinoplanes sp.]
MCPCDDDAGYVCEHHRAKLEQELARIARVREFRGDSAAEAEMDGLRGFYGRRTVDNYLRLANLT